MSVMIRRVRSVAEYHACEDLQRRAWAMQDDLEIVPMHMMVAMQENGGLVLGAFEGSRVVGCVLGFPGLTAEGKPKHCSHLMASDPECQGQGIGYQLKLAQREAALAQGFDLVTWTFDPLQARNAYLNLHKLGGVSARYLPDLYGPLMDGLNAGLPTDRLEVEWWIASQHVSDRLAGGQGGIQDAAGYRAPADDGEWVLRAEVTPDGHLVPGEANLHASSGAVRVEVPLDHSSTKSADLGAARAWRLETRRLFQHYFAAGYGALDFCRHQVERLERGWYVLRRDGREGQPGRRTTEGATGV